MADTSLKYVIEAVDKASDTFAKISDKFEEMGESGKRGAALMATGGAVAGAGIAAFAAGFDELLAGDEALAKVTASMGATEAEARNFGDAAKEVFADNFAGSLAEANEAVGDVVGNISSLRDATAEDIGRATNIASAFATVFETDVTTAAGNAERLIANGLAPNAIAAFDSMTAGMQKLPAGIRDEALSAIDEYSNVFGQLGFSADDAFALMAKSSENGAFGIDKTGDALKELTIRATDMSTASVDAFKVVGLDAQTMANDILAGGDTAQAAMGKIVDGLLGVADPAAQANAAIALFGTPLEDLGTADIPKFLDSLTGIGEGMADTTGAAQKMSDQLSDTAQSGFGQLFNEMKTGLVESLEPLLGPLDSITGFVTENSGVMRIATPIIAGLAVVFGTLTAAVGFFTSGVWASTAALLANPITWIVVAVAALIAAVILLVKNWDKVTEAFATGWQWITDTFSAAGEWFKAHVVDPIVGFFTGLWSSITSGATTAWQWVTEAWGAVSEWFMTYVVDPIVTYFTTLFTVLTWPFRTAIAAVMELWRVIGPWVQANVVQPLVKFFTGLWNALGAGITYVKDLFVRTWGVLAYWVNQYVVQPIVRFYTGLWNIIRSGVSTVVGYFRSGWSVIAGWVSSNVVEPIKRGFTSVKDWVGNVVGGVVGFFRGIGSGIGSAISNVADAITSPFRSAFNAVAGLWNRTIGALDFTIPDWVPNIGGSSFGVPKIPMLAEGGVVDKATLAVIGEAGPEAVVPLDRAGDMGFGGGSAQEMLRIVLAAVDAITEQRIRAALARG